MPTLGQPGASRHRRWLMPAIVLAVGGALAIWGIQREHARSNAIERQIKRLCREVASGISLEGAFNAHNPTVDAAVDQALRELIDSTATADAIGVKVTPGDTPAAGSSSVKATHTVMLSLGVDILGLRVVCDDPDQPITVLGCWTP